MGLTSQCSIHYIQTIPPRGQTAWYNLEKKGKGKPQGNLLLKLSFGSKKNKQVAAQEHRHLLRVLLTHQMNVQKVIILKNRYCYRFPYRVNVYCRFRFSRTYIRGWETFCRSPV